MVRDRMRLCGGLALVLLTLGMAFGRAAADQPQASPAQTAAKGKASPPPATDSQKVLLRYKLAEGESLRYEVTHAAKTLTRVRGTELAGQAHTTSEKLWTVSKVAQDGTMTFAHSVDFVEMMQQEGDKEELRWSSRSGEAPPILFEAVAKQLQKPLVTVSIDPRGQELTREQHGGTELQLGMGGLTLALPEEALAIGTSWSVPREIKVRDPEGKIKEIKVRDSFTLEKVQTGVATIRVRTEVLTPIEAASVKAQIVQQLSNGTIKFDVDAGRVLSKELDWDETVVGFQGENSLMEYRARVTEKLLDGPTRTAKR